MGMRQIVLFSVVSSLAVLLGSCGRGNEGVESRPEGEVTLVLAGQALIKKDPRLHWAEPFGSLQPIIEGADVAFTNFEMAVESEEDRCGLPADYEVVLGRPALAEDARPGDRGGPHAVSPEVMAFFADLGFDLMSLSNNHAWDLGDCGVARTRDAAATRGITFAGIGPDVATATAPAYLTTKGLTLALVAATTSHNSRNLVGHAVNGVWTGRQEDWDRNLEAVREAAAKADFVIFYQHFQIDEDEFAEVAQGDTTPDGHRWVPDVAGWQTEFARAVLDAGAAMYVAHGHRAFDGIELYHGKPLIRQLGGLAYQGLSPVMGNYDEYRPWEGLLARLRVHGGVTALEFLPLELDEGREYRDQYDDVAFLSRRGLARMATGEKADSILTRFRDLSARYGAEVTLEGEQAVVRLDVSRGR